MRSNDYLIDRFFIDFFSVSGELYQGEIQDAPPPPPPPRSLITALHSQKQTFPMVYLFFLIIYLLPLGQTGSSAKMAAVCRNFVVSSQASLSISVSLVTSPRQYLEIVHGAFHTPSTAFRHLPPRKDVVNQCLEFGSIVTELVHGVSRDRNRGWDVQELRERVEILSSAFDLGYFGDLAS